MATFAPIPIIGGQGLGDAFCLRHATIMDGEQYGSLAINVTVP